MRRFAPLVPRRTTLVRLAVGTALAVGLALSTIHAQIPGRNINMVSGDTWPEGDPLLQRQNEPSIAASTRNPLHLLAGSNDYRTVDLPGLGDDEVGDAWLGLYKSFDGGQRWTSSLLPGYPQDDLCNPLKTPNPDPARCAIYGYGAGADPVVRAGTNGLIYYAGLAFDRSLPATPDVPGKSAIFVSRFIDNNNKENGDTFQFIGTSKLKTEAGGAGGDFLDKPWMVVDIPRNNARCTIVTPTEDGPINQSVPAGPVYVAYTLRSTDNQGDRYDVFFTMSTNCGAGWTPPVRLNDKADRANQGATMAIDPLSGDVHTAWRSFDLDGDEDALMTVRFDIQDKKFKALKIARKYLKAKKKKKIDVKKFFKKGGVGAAIQAAVLSPLDQGTSGIDGLLAFRTNAYPSMAIDATGRLYMVWAERGYAAGSPDPVTGDARIVISTSNNGNNWSAPVPIADEAIPGTNPAEFARGHQLMPSIAFAGGKLMVVYYDLRETRSKSFNKFIDDVTAFANPGGTGTGLRHTLDIRASMAVPGAPPVFSPSVRVSDYLEGPMTQGGPSVPLQVNPPNLPMFVRGTAPFIGDYVDVAAAPAMIQDATGKWKYNTAAGPTAPIFHATWTDNRDVRVPLEDVNLDGNPWNDYTPPNYTGGLSPLDPGRFVPVCVPGNAGSRNQNIYSARITGGLLVGSPGNTKKLGFKVDDSGQPTNELMQRSFVVFAQNTSEVEHTFRLTITSQPPGGRASFTQFDPLVTVIEAVVPRRSTASRTVYVTSTDPHARLNVSVAEIAALNGAVVVGGLAGEITLNPDLDNPDLDNPDLDNPDLDNPDLDNLEVYNPDLDNPDLDNPDLDNPDLDNPDLDNPDLDNVRVANPDLDNPDLDNADIENPDIANPDLDNPDLDNADIENTSLMTDITWSITNNGNTTAAYNVNLFFAQTTFRPQIKTQLILYRTYRTPVVQNCALKFETRNVLVANVPNPQLVESSTGEVSDPNDPDPSNATIYLAPGESAKITLRVFDPDPPAGTTVVITNQDGSTAVVPTAFVPNEDVTPVVQQQSVNTEDVEDGVVEPPIVVQFPPPQTVPDSVHTAPHTPVTVNVLGNDSTAFGSTKVISLHPAGMATHSGGTPGDITYQPASGFLYTQRGAIDPNTDTLVGRFGTPPGAFGIFSHQANPRTGINYGRANTPTGPMLTALDTRPGSGTLHQYLTMPGAAEGITNTILNIALDTANHRLYVVHGTTPTVVATTSLSAVDINPDSLTFHDVLFTTVLPGDVRGQAVAVNSRTQKVYVTGTSINGGVFVLDATVPNPPALKIPGTNNAWGIVVNEAANLVFAATNQSNNFALYAIDAATLATTTITTAVPMRFGPVEERLALHEATGKVFMRLETSVVIIDGQRGSPTRNTVVGIVSGLGRDPSPDIAVDQGLGLVITVGGFEFRADIIDAASNGLVATIPLLNNAIDVAIDQVNHRAFVSVPLTHVQEISLNPIAPTARVAVFIESAGAVLNPVTNKAYSPFQAITGGIAMVAGAGFGGVIPGLRPEGRYVDSARHVATNRYFILNQGNQAGTSPAPGSMIVIDGATDAVIDVLDTLPNPFGIGINQATGTVYVASLQSPLGAGGIQMFDATDLAAPPVLVGGAGSLPPPINTNALQTFGRYVVPNPATNTTYAQQLNANASAASIVEISAAGQMAALDGTAALPLGNTWGRAEVIRVSASNRVYIGMFDGATGTVRIVAMDGATHAVLGTWVGGRSSGRHTPSYLIENNDKLYVTDFTNNIVTMLDGLTMTPLTVTALPEGPSATAFNVAANRLYVSSLTSKTLTALDGTSLAILSTVRLPLVAHFLYVDEIESRLYTSGGDSSDESGIMVVTDVLGQLGANVSVSAVGTASNGLVQLNADYSVTYTPDPGFMGVDQFSYTITAPTGSANGTVTINVVPSVPTSFAFGDAYTTTVNQLLTVPAPGPLGNDATGGPATMVVTQTTSDGVLTGQPDGSFTYQPDPGFTGTDTFQYHTQGALGASNTATVTIAVTAALDLVVVNINDSGAGSLRQAMLTANIEPGASIRFDIPGAGPHTILPDTALPAMSVPVTIDGFTQPSSSPNTAFIGTNAVMKIIVRGPASGAASGFNIRGGSSTIRGLVINGFTSGPGILLDTAGGNTIEGNFIGTDAAGVAAAPNQLGVSSQSPNNLIGGTSPASRNLISGNSNQGARALASSSNGVITSIGSGTMFKNNLIGTRASGMTALPNNGGGLTMSAPNVVVGGPTAAERNVISGNGNTGISAFANVFTPAGGGTPIVVSAANGLVVQGNFIGATADGGSALGNGNGGVSASVFATIGGGAGTTPGDSCTGACNVISGNNGTGVSLSNSYDGNAASPTAGMIYSSAANSVVEGNYIGVTVNGSAPAVGTIGNTSQGVNVSAPDVQIGGGSPATRNVIAGNGAGTGNAGIHVGTNTLSNSATLVASGAGTVIRGNYIGLNAPGTLAVPNGNGITVVVPNVRIGGTTPADRNIISGNLQNGINTFANTFNPGGAPIVITVPSGLVVQGNYIGTTLNGLAALANGSGGLYVTGAGSIIGGDAGTTPGGACTGACNLISGNTGNGLSVTTSTDNASQTLTSSAAGSFVEGNFVGVNLTGTAAIPNTFTGIFVGAANVRVGGTTAAHRNVVSGNGNTGISFGTLTYGSGGTVVASTGAGGTVVGNYVGLNSAGTGAIGNLSNGIFISVPSITIGGVTPGDRNVIAGSSFSGISSSAARNFPGQVVLARPTDVVVQGNYVGTNAAGTAALPNNGGIRLTGADSTVGGSTGTSPGGSCTGACNLVSGNTSQGISLNADYDNATGNVFSTAAGSTVEGNFVGVDVTGLAALPNTSNGINSSVAMATIGGSALGARNLVAGNTAVGISVSNDWISATNTLVSSGNGTIVRGNLIGLNTAGSAAISNGGSGINSQAANVTIGGPGAGDGNVIGNVWPHSGITLQRLTNSAVVINAAGNNLVRGNQVGLTADQSTRLGGAAGVNLGSAGNQVIGNILAGGGNAAASQFSSGVSINDAAAIGNVISGNTIGTNAAGAAGLGYSGSGVFVSHGSNNTIGGGTAGDRNVIVGNTGNGVSISTQSGATADGNIIRGNHIGVMDDGATVMANGQGISLFASTSSTIAGTIIGGPGGSRNVLSGNTAAGISLGGANTTGTMISGNYIGVAADGTTARGNLNNGIFINDAVNNTIGGSAGEGNIIANNTNIGIAIQNVNANRIKILGNSIFTNSGLGIDLNWNGVTANENGDADTGANDLQNFPVITDASNTAAETQVTVDLSSFANGNYTLQFFANPTCDSNGHGEGELLLGSFPASAPGSGPFTFMLPQTAAGHAVTATATDSNGNTSEFSACAIVNGTQVTNAGDSGAGSLRAAITNANAMPGTQTITFNIAGASPASPALIAAASSLPVITQPVVIDATTQQGWDNRPVVELTSVNLLTGRGFDVQANNVTIRGLMITKFNEGISTQVGTTGHVFERNVIGTNRDNLAGLGNFNGINVQAGGTLVQHNVIGGNSNDVQVSKGASNTVANNIIGVGHDGLATLPSGNAGIVVFDGASDTAIDGNLIAGKGGWGVDIQNTGAHPGNTRLRNNTIGLNANGAALGNAFGGVRNDWGNGTRIGEAGARNIISGNGGPGVWISGNPVTIPLIQNNYIGTDPSGLADRGNVTNGITVDGPSPVQIGGTSTGERNVISGNDVTRHRRQRIDQRVAAHHHPRQHHRAGCQRRPEDWQRQLRDFLVRVRGHRGRTGPGHAQHHLRQPAGHRVQQQRFDEELDRERQLHRHRHHGHAGSRQRDGHVGGQRAGHRDQRQPDLRQHHRPQHRQHQPPGDRRPLQHDGPGQHHRPERGHERRAAQRQRRVARQQRQPDRRQRSGAANVIAGNTLAGLTVNNVGVRNRISQNVIKTNGALGIDLGNDGLTPNDNGDPDGGGNTQLNFPVLSGATSSAGPQTTVNVDISTFAVGNYTVEFFASVTCDASGHGEGERFVGSRVIVQPGAGNVTLDELVPEGQFLTATATDAAGNTSEFGGCVVIDVFVVNANNTGTGSLRNALTISNSTPGKQTIRFNIPGAGPSTPAFITLATVLPEITDAVTIDGTSQPGYDGQPVITVDGGGSLTKGFATAFDVSDVTIKGLALTRFAGEAIYMLQAESGTGNIVESNIIGTDRFGSPAMGNNTGVLLRADNSFIRENLISGNGQGIRLETDADDVVIESNKIGTNPAGTSGVPNVTGIVMFDSLNDTRIDDNLIAFNSQWGIDIQDSLAGDVTDTLVRGNTIGLDAAGNDAGNLGGGIRINNAPGTVIGQPGYRNIISGNGGAGAQIGYGIHVIGSPAVMPTIQDNYIGLDPTGIFARANNNKGVVLEGPAKVGGINANEGNWISGHSDAAGGAGIFLGLAAGGSIIQGNVIGLNAADDAVGNGFAGIMLTSTSAVTVDGNVASGNFNYGIAITRATMPDPLPSGHIIQRNMIGTDATGTLSRGNGGGGILAGGNNLTIGGAPTAGNTIVNSGSGGGVSVLSAVMNVRITSNAIDNNGGLGIDLGVDGLTVNDSGDIDTGANGLQNFPQLSNANNAAGPTQVTYTTTSFAAGTYELHFYVSSSCDASFFGEGKTFVAAVSGVAGGSGATHNFGVTLPLGSYITATATDASGNTSEFSGCALVIP